MASQAEVIRANQAADIARQVAATNFATPEVEQLANGIPTSGNDAAFAAHIKETRDKSVEYARLQVESDRQAWEAQVAANYRRDHANKQNLTDQANIAKANREHENRIVGDSITLQMQALTEIFPPNWTPETLPLDRLQKLSNLRQKVQDLATAMGAPGLADGV